MRREFVDLCKDFAAIRANLAQALAGGDIAAGHRPFVEGLASEFDQALANFQKDFPRGLDELDRRQQATRDQVAELKSQQEDLDRQVEAIGKQGSQPSPTRAPPPPPTFGSQYAESLRASLLQLAGIPTTPPDARDSADGSVWKNADDVSWDESTPGEAPSTAAPEAKDAWDPNDSVREFEEPTPSPPDSGD